MKDGELGREVEHAVLAAAIVLALSGGAGLLALELGFFPQEYPDDLRDAPASRPFTARHVFPPRPNLEMPCGLRRTTAGGEPLELPCRPGEPCLPVP
ncbi:MAG: hypothetical protein HY553_16225 [Elusimicrobia bacterium]|nr:hypothetical protein [Elusimicrobiota bacterium]